MLRLKKVILITYHILDGNQRAISKEREVKKAMRDDDVLRAFDHRWEEPKTRRQRLISRWEMIRFSRTHEKNWSLGRGWLSGHQNG